MKRSQAIQEESMAETSTRREADRPATPNFNYELFNCNNFNIRYWSWNYRGCWHLLDGVRKADIPRSTSCSGRRPMLSAYSPDLPSGSFSSGNLNPTHSDHRAFLGHGIIMSLRYLAVTALGNFRACCLPWKW